MKLIQSFAASFLVVLFSACSYTAAIEAQTLKPVISESVAAVSEVSPVAYDGHAGLMFVRKPPGEGPFPAVLLIHGGAPGWDKKTLADFAVHIHASRFLEAGYVVAAVTRRDLDLSLAVSVEQAPVRDVMAAYDWIAGQSYVDADSIVVRGTSVGGYLALELAAARKPAAVLVEEPFSFPFLGVAIGNTAAEPDTTRLERVSSAMMLIRGDQTANINDFNRTAFIPAALRLGLHLEVRTWAGELHSFAFYDNAERTVNPHTSLEAFQALDAFSREHLKVQPVSLEPALVSHEAIEY